LKAVQLSFEDRRVVMDAPDTIHSGDQGAFMIDLRSRREFLKVTAGGVASLARAEMLANAQASSAIAPSPRSEIGVRLTDKTRKYASVKPLEWKPSPRVTADAITIRADKRQQPVLGFGAAFTDAACYIFNQLAPNARAELFHELFSPTEMGLSVGRVSIGSSDYSVSVYSYNEGTVDPELKRFSIDHDSAYILPMLTEARKVNPELFLLASPWSPPGWMKSSGTMLGGAIWRRYFAAYATYLTMFLKAYQVAGVPINSITSQNEVDTDQGGKMPAAMWPQVFEMDFVRDHLGPKIAAEGLDTKIWLLDHNCGLWGRAVCMLDDPGVKEVCRRHRLARIRGNSGLDEPGARVPSRHQDVLDRRRTRHHRS
jgi:glucosylceramidase